MHAMSFSDIAGILQKKPLQFVKDYSIESILTDSRKLETPESTLFFSINSERRSADAFIENLYQNGVRCFIVDQRFSHSNLIRYPDGNFIQVDQVVQSLQLLATFHRHQFSFPIIGITGSNGKTIVKEWMFQLLHGFYNIVRNPKSFNSQIGVPLSIWQMNANHTLGIFEAGISKPGEMQALRNMIDPNIGVFTMIGDAHAEGFSSEEEKINEKLNLFLKSSFIIYNEDQHLLDQCIQRFKQEKNSGLQLFSWSKNNSNADLYINKIESVKNGTVVYCNYLNNSFDFFIPFSDEASIHNAITCSAIMLHLKIHETAIAAGVSQLKPVAMRLEMKAGQNNCSIINDSYSADLNSLVIALDFLDQQQQHTKHSLILSDVLQSGLAPEKLYEKIASLLSRRKLFRFIGIGEGITKYAELFKSLSQTSFYHSTEEYLNQLRVQDFKDETILLKGSRVFQFEQISRILEHKQHDTVLEINLNALRHNLNLYSGLLQPKVKRMVMVKAFSYGSGSYEIANLLQHAGVEYLAVAYADEGVSLRKSGIRLPIMVMNAEEAGFDNLVQYELEPELYGFHILDSYNRFLLKQGITGAPVHIKLDTGMHRLGFMNEDCEELCARLVTMKSIRVVSVFSHLAASGEALHDEFTREQGRLFKTMSEKIRKIVGYDFLEHLANTSAIHRFPELQLDMVRLGIGLYGIDPDQQLQTVTTLKTSISQIKKLHKAESVGYSRAAILERETRIAVVRIGYADGYPRNLGNGKGYMLVHGKPAPVIGNVCMDMTMLDITDIEASETDEVIVFGAELPVNILAKKAGTIPYEILTNISQRVKRVYYEE